MISFGWAGFVRTKYDSEWLCFPVSSTSCFMKNPFHSSLSSREDGYSKGRLPLGDISTENLDLQLPDLNFLTLWIFPYPAFPGDPSSVVSAHWTLELESNIHILTSVTSNQTRKSSGSKPHLHGRITAGSFAPQRHGALPRPLKPES
jgi:hypothetical protein